MIGSRKGLSGMHSELGQRIASAIVMLIIVLWACWLGGWPFLLVSSLLSALLFYEWQAMVRVTPFDGAEALLTAGFAVVIVCNALGLAIYGIVAFLALGIGLELTSRGQEKADIRWIGLGAAYCAIPAIALPEIRENGGFSMMMFLFLVVWVTDIAAYFVGRRFGGPKLLPVVSPKKTWSGALGGLFASLLLAVIIARFSPSTSVTLLLVAAVGLSVVSQVGDLFESWVKRRFSVKDSSGLIPGHGGFLDRLDGLVAAAVPVAIAVGLSY